MRLAVILPALASPFSSLAVLRAPRVLRASVVLPYPPFPPPPLTCSAPSHTLTHALPSLYPTTRTHRLRHTTQGSSHTMSRTILDEIVDNRRAEVEQAKRNVPEAQLRARIEKLSAPRNFRAVLKGAKVRVIAEVKRASPSEGDFGQLYDPRVLAQEYSGNGAAAVSCVTDEKYFQGDGFMVHRARHYMPLPVIRKDFITDDYQVYESRALEADAILLIVAALSDLELRLLHDLAQSLGMGVLVETHDRIEVERALDAGARIIGVNNRNLKTMQVDLAHTEAVAHLVPQDRVLVSESGIKTRQDVERLSQCGVDAILVGSLLMNSEDPGRALRPLTSVDARPGSRPSKRPLL